MSWKLDMYKAYIRIKLPTIRIKNTFMRRNVKFLAGIGLAIVNFNVFLKIFICDYLIVPQMDYVITTRCTLKCKECADLMPLFQGPQNYDLEELNKDIHRLLDTVDAIYELRILGGEPFVHPQLAEVIMEIVDDPRIKKIVLFTNGTIVPQNERLVQVLKNKKVSIEISDYGTLSRKKDDLLKFCKKENIECTINFIPSWVSFGDLSFRGRSQNELERQFHACNNGCRSYLEGHVYYCERAASGTVLNYIPNEERDIVDIRNGYVDRDLTRKRLMELCFGKKSIIACQYCDKGTDACKVVPIAEQVKVEKRDN